MRIIVVLFVLMISFQRAQASESDIRCSFIAFEIGGADQVDSFFQLIKPGLTLDRNGFGALTNLVDSMARIDVVVSDGKYSTNDQYLVQFAEEKGDKFVLSRTDLQAGISCDFEIESNPAGGYHLRGNCSYYEVSSREVFDPYPSLEAGKPMGLMGGGFAKGLILPSKKLAKIATVTGDRDRITGFVFLIDRDLSLEQEGEKNDAPEIKYHFR